MSDAQPAEPRSDAPEEARETTPRGKSYAPTPRQLEALEKARAAKRAAREKRKRERSREREVVRDNRMVSSFVGRGGIPVRQTELGQHKRQRVNDGVVLIRRDRRDDGWNTTLALSAAAVAGIVGLATVGYIAQQNGVRLPGQSPAALPAPQESREEVARPSGAPGAARGLHLPPWERP